MTHLLDEGAQLPGGGLRRERHLSFCKVQPQTQLHGNVCTEDWFIRAIRCEDWY